MILLLLLTTFRQATPVADAGLAERLAKVAVGHEATLSYAVLDPATGERFGGNADRVMPTASLIKLPVMVAAYREAAAGRLDLDRPIALTDADRVTGSGILTTHFAAGDSLRLRTLVRLMIAWSDNTATNMVLTAVGLDAVNRHMQELGLDDTRVHSLTFRRDLSVDPENSRRYGLGRTTAAEMTDLLRRLDRGELADEAATAEMLGHLAECRDGGKLGRFLPAGAAWRHKTGEVAAARADAGVMTLGGRSLIVCGLVAGAEDQRLSDDSAPNRLLAEVGRACGQALLPTGTPGGPPMGSTLRTGDVGRKVEALQRALNAKVQPSPELTVDGDYGPGTAGAVMAWQRQQGWPATGAADERVLASLPLDAAEPAPPTPAEVAAEDLPLRPADASTGLPFVSCKAWAVADPESGELLMAHDADRPLDIASTTKVMTAYLCLREIAAEPKLADAQIAFSGRADRTVGSTAGVGAGERVKVADLLYGLLLPSGNDASVALAEFFGGRFAAATADGPADPLDRFVAEMNRAAAELGMTASHFENTSGLTAANHKASAADLVRLTVAALKLPRFAAIVATRQYGATLGTPGGQTRNVVWKNTNRLLPIAGYDGVKTGTTNAAGACLIATASRAGKHRLVVILGASGSSARYADARNLFRAAWNR